MDEETGRVKEEPEWQDALIVEIATLAREFAEQFAPDEAEDLAQDVVLECLTRLREHRWPTPESLPGLLNRIVARRAQDREEREENAAERDEVSGDACHPDEHTWMSALEQLEEDEVMAACRAALGHVSPRSAVVYSLVRHDGMSTRDVAAALGTSVDAVSSHLRRAECAIRAELLALGLMPVGTAAPIGMLLDAQAQVPAVLTRRRRERRRAEKERRGGLLSGSGERFDVDVCSGGARPRARRAPDRSFGEAESER